MFLCLHFWVKSRIVGQLLLNWCGAMPCRKTAVPQAFDSKPMACSHANIRMFNIAFWTGNGDGLGLFSFLSASISSFVSQSVIKFSISSGPWWPHQSFSSLPKNPSTFLMSEAIISRGCQPHQHTGAPPPIAASLVHSADQGDLGDLANRGETSSASLLKLKGDPAPNREALRNSLRPLQCGRRFSAPWIPFQSALIRQDLKIRQTSSHFLRAHPRQA